MKTLWYKILDWWKDRQLGALRDARWATARKYHLKHHPRCEVTGDTKGLEVHHIQPFHLFPKEELNPDNLITLRRDIHLLFGHLGSWSSWNVKVAQDVAEWRLKISNKPLSTEKFDHRNG